MTLELFVAVVAPPLLAQAMSLEKRQSTLPRRPRTKDERPMISSCADAIHVLGEVLVLQIILVPALQVLLVPNSCQIIPADTPGSGVVLALR